MTGPDHFKLAEVAQEAAAAMQASRPGGPACTPTEALLDALVHATLALAAATAPLPYGHGELDGTYATPEVDAWQAVLGVPLAGDPS